MKPIFTIEYFNNGYYFDLLSNLKFSVSFNEKVVLSSRNPNDCIKYLKEKNCMCSEDYDYTYLAE